jgi:hypothetical protein
MHTYWHSSEQDNRANYVEHYPNMNADIHLSKDYYYPGELVEGTFTVQISTDKVRPVSLDVDFIGKEHANFWTSTQITHRTFDTYEDQAMYETRHWGKSENDMHHVRGDGWLNVIFFWSKIIGNVWF